MKPLSSMCSNFSCLFFLPLHLKQTFPHMIWIFTEGEGDKAELAQVGTFFPARISALASKMGQIKK